MNTPEKQRTRLGAARHLLCWTVAVGVLALASGCVSKAGEARSARTEPVSTSQSSSTSSPPTTVTPDAAIGVEAAEILASADVKRFNDRICPGTPHIAPVSSIGSDYTGTQPAGIDTYNLPTFGESVAVRLTVRPGEADLVLILGLNYNTYSWCAYSTEWCPVEYPGLPPFTGRNDSDTPALHELERTILCRH